MKRFRVVDLETGGLEPPASIIEIGWCDLLFDPDTKHCEISGPWSRLYRPVETLTPANIAVHHLTNAMLAGFELLSCAELQQVMLTDTPDFYVAANASFEKKWITSIILGTEPTARPYWICTVKAAARLYPDAESCSNQAIRYQLELDLPDTLAMPPHRAAPDSYVTAHILARFLQTTPVRQLVEWEREPRYMTKCPIGQKWRGKPWADVDEGFLQWMLKQPDMDPDAVHWARIELERRRGSV